MITHGVRVRSKRSINSSLVVVFTEMRSILSRCRNVPIVVVASSPYAYPCLVHPPPLTLSSLLVRRFAALIFLFTCSSCVSLDRYFLPLVVVAAAALIFPAAAASADSHLVASDEFDRDVDGRRASTLLPEASTAGPERSSVSIAGER